MSLRFHLCMMRYNFSIVHVPGKALFTVDALSRAPLLSDSTDCFDHANLNVKKVQNQ